MNINSVLILLIIIFIKKICKKIIIIRLKYVLGCCYNFIFHMKTLTRHVIDEHEPPFYLYFFHLQNLNLKPMLKIYLYFLYFYENLY